MIQENNKFYTCRYDAAFKEVFQKEENKDILICLLEDILNVKILDVEYLNCEKLNRNVYVKAKRVDLSLKTDIGYIQVEVNTSNEDYLYPRNMAYICNTYSNHVLKGQNYDEDVKVVQINFTYNKKPKELFRVFNIMDSKGHKFVGNFIIYEFYMDNYTELWYNKADEEIINKNKHIIMLDLKPEELINMSDTDKVVKKYMSEINNLNKNPDFVEYMSAEEDARKIMNSLKKAGLKEGLEQGIEQGIEQGSSSKAVEIACSMLVAGEDIDKISKYTGLSIEEIKSIGG